MKRLSRLALISSVFIFTAGMCGAASAELATIYGPAYISKTKKEGEEHHRKSAKFTFSAPVPGKGVIVIKNGGDSGKKSRAGYARIELNGVDVSKRKNFDKQTETLKSDVQLLSTNELEIEVKHCRECEVEVTVLGEKMMAPPPPAMMPAPPPMAAPVP